MGGSVVTYYSTVRRSELESRKATSKAYEINSTTKNGWEIFFVFLISTRRD